MSPSAGELARQHQQIGDRQVGDGIGVSAGRVQDRDAESGGRLDIDVHRIATTRGHHAQVGKRCHAPGIDDVDLGDEHLEPLEFLHQGVARQQPHALAEGRVLDVSEGLHRRQRLVVEARGDEDARAHRSGGWGGAGGGSRHHPG